MAEAAEADRRRRRRTWAVSAAGIVAGMAAVLAMCGPGSGEESSGVVAFPDASTTPPLAPSPAVSPTTGLLPVPAPSPLPSPTSNEGARPAPAPGGPEAAPVLAGGAPTGAVPGAEGGELAGSPRPKPSRSPRPAPTRATHAPGGPAAPAPTPATAANPTASAPAHAPAAAPPAASVPGAGGGTICDQAEHFGRWPAGSEQARICRGIYG
ncbi:hypothetical protein WN990_36360 [Kitasatospora purpeofusca]|uniref:hypothetical protein n=1 Tax=Kitasatospora purpeofusca TaxID=67352 RepID=UPI0030F31347